jgi:hypothetical protein
MAQRSDVETAYARLKHLVFLITSAGPRLTGWHGALYAAGGSLLANSAKGGEVEYLGARRRINFGTATLMAACFTVLIFLHSSTVLAAVRQSPTCGVADVEAAVNSAQDGDTILIPAGTCAWTKVMSVNKNITIQGAGIDQTVLVHAIPWSTTAATQMFIFNTKVGGQMRLTGMTLDGGVGDKDPKIRGMVNFAGSGTTWRLDHVRLKITRTLGVVYNNYTGKSYGVIDHNIFEMAGWGMTGITGWHSAWGDKLYGDGSWAAPSNLGSGQAVYVEDNLFRGPVDRVVVAHGGYGGERIVWRKNRHENSMFANHGTESTSRWRGGRVIELYDNTFVMTASYHVAMGLRSGVAVFFNNTVTGPIHNVASVHNFRSDQAYSPWGKCDGTSAWDGNDGPQAGYPCLDQPGRGQSNLISGSSPTPIAWPNQQAEPSYAWNNRLNGATGRLVSETVHIVEGRDFFNSPRPGYTPYVYPHPLVSGTATATTTAAPPTGLQVH